VFRRCLRQARIQQVESSFSVNLLVGNALTHGQHRLQAVLNHRNLGKATAAGVLDHVYGLDHVIDIGDGVLVGIDLTLDASKLADKLRKARSLRKLTAPIGIAFVYVIHMVGDVTAPSQHVIDASIEAFWAQLTDDFNESKTGVRTFRFHIS
jgi:hypothetical protein